MNNPFNINLATFERGLIQHNAWCTNSESITTVGRWLCAAILLYDVCIGLSPFFQDHPRPLQPLQPHSLNTMSLNTVTTRKGSRHYYPRIANSPSVDVFASSHKILSSVCYQQAEPIVIGQASCFSNTSIPWITCVTLNLFLSTDGWADGWLAAFLKSLNVWSIRTGRTGEGRTYISLWTSYLHFPDM